MLEPISIIFGLVSPSFDRSDLSNDMLKWLVGHVPVQVVRLNRGQDQPAGQLATPNTIIRWSGIGTSTLQLDSAVVTVMGEALFVTP